MASTTAPSAASIIAALRALGIEPPDRDGLMAISAVCRQEFLDALSACRESNDANREHWEFLSSIAFVASLPARRVLESCGVQSTPKDVLAVAMHLPKKFAQAILAVTGNGTSKAENESFLKQSLQPAVHLVPARESNTESGDFLSAHAYGTAYALCFNAITGREGEFGVMLDAAGKTDNKIDWKQAIHVWLSIEETMGLLAVFCRWTSGVEFAGHGPRKSKSVVLQAQGDNFYCKVTDRTLKDQPVRAVPIVPLAAMKIAFLLRTQIHRKYQHLPSSEVLDMIRAIYTPSDRHNLAS